MQNNYTPSFLLKLQKIMLFVVLFSITEILKSQTVLISPSGNGGFETGTTFASNNWTAVNGTQVNPWVLGTATQPAAGGIRTAYISNDNGISNNYTFSYSTTHLYYDVVFPAS